ncbi:putative cadmium/zinc-transporting ATPase 3 [Hordeum vulgare]|nr:putative cadmium/zinc-transporting ATPase 3 [Hordeum vulgare]
MKGEKNKKVKAFTFHHCYKELKDEKWKTRETFDASKKKSVVIEDEEDIAGEERRPTPHSVTKSYRRDGNKKVKGTKAGDNELKEGFDAIVMARKEYAEEKRMLKLKKIEERSEAERRRATAEERKVELEEMKMVEEKALKYMFMDTSTLDPKAKAFVELCRDEMLMRQMMMGGGMGGAMGGYMNMMGGAMNAAFGGNMGGGFGGNMEGGFGGMGGGFGGNMGGGFGGNMMGGYGGGYGGNMNGMGGNEGASSHALGNDTTPPHNVDKEAGDHDDRTTVHNTGGVDDPHE